MTKPKIKILVADDEFSARDVISSILTNEGYEVETAEDGREAMAMLDDGKYAICITDLKMPHADGIQVLEHIRDRRLKTTGIIATGHGSIESAISAMRAEAFDYLTKPFHIDEIRHVVKKAMEFRNLQSENIKLKRQIRSTNKIDNIIGAHHTIEHLKDTIRTVADSDSTTLVLGASGTGKELVARAIHAFSDRADAPMIPVNCGAIPEDLLESELFGHVKGAFTGATLDRPGRFQLADGGTIFLDEIGDMSPKLQVKVLRVLQEQEFEPVGSTETVKVNVRIVAATHRDLEERVREGQFREDLYYRLNVIPIQMPPLRDRLEDLPLLIDHFIAKFNKMKGRNLQGFTPQAIAELQRQQWPGNVRELENLVERMIIFNREGVVGVEQLPDKYRGGATSGGVTGQPGGGLAMPSFDVGGIDLNRVVGEFEHTLIKQALQRCDGVKNRAAQLLGIKRTTLVEKLKKYNRIFGESSGG